MGAALALASAVTYAQPVAPEQANAVELAKIPLRNAPSTVVAYWLDPAHQQMPMQFRYSLHSGASPNDLTAQLPRQPSNGNGPRDLQLPAGVSSVVSIDPQNVLLAKGNRAGLEALRQLVA